MSRSSLSGSSTCRSGGRRRALAGVLALAGAVTIATSVRALDAERGLSQYLRDHWGSESGFPGGPVYAIAQTSDGYLWIGAEKGLVRFDGLTFRLDGRRLGRARRASGARRGRRRGWQLVGAPQRHRPRPPSRGPVRQPAGGPGRAALGRYRDGSRHGRRDAARDARPRRPGATAAGASIPLRFPATLPSFVISIAEAAERRALARQPGRRHPPDPRGARQPPCRRFARLEDQFPARHAGTARCGSGQTAAWRGGTGRRSRRRACRPRCEPHRR